MTDLDRRRLEAEIEDVVSAIHSRRKLLDSLVGTLYPPVVLDEIVVLNKKFAELSRELARSKNEIL